MALKPEPLRWIPGVGLNRALVPSDEIGDFDWTSRAYKRLTQLQIETLRDLPRYSEQELLAVEGLGKKTLMEIKDMLRAYNLELRSEKAGH